MKKILIGLLIFVIVIFGGLYFYVKYFQKSATVTPPAPDSFTLAYTDVTFTIGDPYFFLDGECDPINDNDLSETAIIVDGRTAIPMELLDAAFNVNSNYDTSTGNVTISNDTSGFNVVLSTNSGTGTINGQAITTDSQPFVQDNIVYLPLKFVTDHSDCQTSYADATKQITITSKSSTASPDQINAINSYKQDSYNAYMLAKAAAQLCTTNQTFIQMTDFSRQVTIDFKYVQPYVADDGIDFTTINTGQAPWVVSVYEGEYLITDSAVQPKTFFQGAIENTSPSPSPSPTPTSEYPDIAPDPGATILPPTDTPPPLASDVPTADVSATIPPVQ